MRELVAVAKLAPDEKVLDVGCGPGRTAIPLTTYLSGAGGYEGFDISAEAIQWCREHIRSRFPNFRFMHVDVFNGLYNPSGVIQPSRFTFPYHDEQFDLAFLYSVFTHMLPADVEQYVSEVARVVRKGGRVLATFFLLTERRLAEFESAVAADPAIGGGVPKDLLDNDLGDYSAGYEVAESALAYKESVVRSLFAERGLQIREPILYGSWSDWPSTVRFDGTQDVVLAYR